MSAIAGPEAAGEAPLRVLRVYHSAVVGEWRRRDAELGALGAEVVVASARRWWEAGAWRTVARRPGERVLAVRTIGRHPYGFVYDPRPLWAELRRRPLDVLDVHEEPAALATFEVLVLAALAGQGRVPACAYSAQNLPKRYPVPFRWIERWVLRRVAGVHTCNQAAGRILEAKGFRGEVEDLGLGVDLERFDAGRHDDGPPPGQLRVGYVGRLAAEKGVWVLLDAVTGLDGLEVELLGDGPERPALAAAVAERGAPVHVVGPVEPADLPTWLARLDVLAVPSTTTPGWVEQFGRVAVEAMAAGVVVVASDSGALPEVVGDAGVVVPEGDAAALRAALKALRDDPGRRADLVAAGRARAQRWSWAAIAGRQLAFYRRFAAVPRRHRSRGAAR